MRILKNWYYGAMFLLFGLLFDIALKFSDDWETCQNLLTTCMKYGTKWESTTK